MAWVLDSSHSTVKFQARHLMISNVHGNFEKVSGTIDFNEAEPEKTVVDVKIEAASINTKDEKRDGHLKSPDFFDIANHPHIVFTSTKAEDVDHDGSWTLLGDLTINGITKPVKLDAEFGGVMKDPWGNTKAGITINGKLNRKDWNLNWNAALEAGGMLVSDEVRIACEVQLVKQG